MGANMWARWLLLVSLALGKVFILSPQELVSAIIDQQGGEKANKTEVPFTIANFGNPPYGTELLGKVFFHPEDNFACYPLDHITVPKEDGVPILLADRGNCTFALKARHAQDAGYKALVLIDNVDEPVEEIIMSDNGSGGNIFIAVLMVRADHGNQIKHYVAQQQHVELRLTFDIEKRSRVSLRVVYSSDNAKAYSFFKEFALYVSHFNSTNLVFHPHFALWYSIDAKAENFENEKQDCLGGGRYCAPDPDGEGALTGRDIVLEDLRQICLLKHSLKSSSSYSLWFDYTARFDAACREKHIDDACSYKVMADLGFSSLDVQRCVNESAVGDIAKNKNSLLEKEMKTWKNLGIEFFPAILINNRTYRGDWEGLQVAQTICSGYFEAPEFCRGFFPQDEAKPIVLATGTVILLVVVLLVLIIAVLVLYRAWVKRELNLEMRQQVNLAVSQYYALNAEGSQMAERKSSTRSN